MDREDIIKRAAEVWNTGSFYPIPSSDDILRFAALVAAAEREAIAVMVEDWDSDSADPRDIADAIRARGNT